MLEISDYSEEVISSSDEDLNGVAGDYVQIKDHKTGSSGKISTNDSTISIDMSWYGAGGTTLYLYVNNVKTDNSYSISLFDNSGSANSVFTYNLPSIGTYDIKVDTDSHIYESNHLTYIYGDGETAPINQEKTNATIVIYDINYPNNSTISSNGDYIADIAYTITKYGQTFSDESLIVVVNNNNIGTTTPNASNRLGHLTINQNNKWIITIIYSATINGEKFTVKSNNLTYITKNTSGGDIPVSEPSVNITILDYAAPNNSTIYSDGQYQPDIRYIIGKEGDFVNENLEIFVNGESLANITPNSSNQINSLIFAENEIWAVYVVYSGEVKGEKISKSSNTLIFNTTKTIKKPEIPDSLMLIIDDVDYPNVLTAYVLSNIDGDYLITVNTNKYDVSVKDGFGFIIFTLPANSYTAEVVSKINSEFKNSTTFKVNNQNIINKSTINAENLVRAINSPFDYKATFYDVDGEVLNNTEVLFIINGNDYEVVTDEYGVAKLAIGLTAGEFEVTMVNPATSETIIRNITIVNRISDNKNVNVDYTYTGTYKIRLFADNGNPVGMNEIVVITLNGKSVNVKTDKNGYATFKVQGLLPKTYTITSEYKGFKVSNKITVKQILKANNAKYKRYKVKKYTATLKTSLGKAIKGKKVTFKIKGKTYTAKTNKKGVATIKIKRLYKVGNHKIVISYLKSSIKKTITVKR